MQLHSGVQAYENNPYLIVPDSHIKHGHGRRSLPGYRAGAGRGLAPQQPYRRIRRIFARYGKRHAHLQLMAPPSARAFRRLVEGRKLPIGGDLTIRRVSAGAFKNT